MSTTRDRRRDIDEEDENRRRRISREIVRVESEIDNEEEEDEDEEDEEARPAKRPLSTKRAKADDEDEDEDEDDEGSDEDDEEESEEEDENRSHSLWQHIITGGFIAGDNASQYYRYLIAIALMCFVSIFLTFMSLNADDEYRSKEKHIALLRERSVLKSEERYRVASRDEVVKRLDREYGIKMVEQESSQRMK
jgi:hypothetical protein